MTQKPVTEEERAMWLDATLEELDMEEIEDAIELLERRGFIVISPLDAALSVTGDGE